MIITLANSQKILKITKKQVAPLVQEVITFEGQNCSEVSVNFVSKAKIAKLHGLYFQDPSPTDCISFPMDSNPNDPFRVLGEIFVCPEVAKEYAIKHNLNEYTEVSLYIIHGLLHLMGYNDIQVEDRKKMRQAEKRHMAHLKKLNMLLHS